MSTKALLVVSFGTSYPHALEQDIEATERDDPAQAGQTRWGGD